MSWTHICSLASLPHNAGIAAWLGTRPVAIFNLGERGLFALDNREPGSGVSLLARGQLCELDGELYVCSPLYKQHFHLLSGECLEEPGLKAEPLAIKHEHGAVWLAGEV